MKIRILFWPALFVAFIALSGFALWRLVSIEAPTETLAEARQMIADAKKNQADIYHSKAFAKAKMLYDSAMATWELENDRSYFLRDYEVTISLANQSKHWSSDALKDVTVTKNKHQASLEEKVIALENHINTYRRQFGRVPISENSKKELTKAELLLSEARESINNGSWMTVEGTLALGTQKIDSLKQDSESILNKYFESFPAWAKVKAKAINDSNKKGSYLILADKYAGKCYLYKNGNQLKSYKAEFGINWIGDKVKEGDKTTPEGEYKIVKKKQNGETRFYKAFLLDYPNEDDKKRFAENQKTGRISPNQAIGGLIEIHGHGGKGMDWTDGCIALTNEDMDDIYAKCPAGTPVVIVGSLLPLNELIK